MTALGVEEVIALELVPKYNTILTTLELNSSNIGRDEEVTALGVEEVTVRGAALQHNTILPAIEFYSSTIGAEGVTALGMAL